MAAILLHTHTHSVTRGHFVSPHPKVEKSILSHHTRRRRRSKSQILRFLKLINLINIYADIKINIKLLFNQIII